MKMSRYISIMVNMTAICVMNAVSSAEQKYVKEFAPIMGRSGYPVPRFTALASEKVNVRSGPDLKYPIKWVYQKKNLPLKIIAEYKDWRKVIDNDGDMGWIWQKLLKNRRMAVILPKKQALYRYPKRGAKIKLYAEKSVIGKILKCHKSWCLLDIQDYKGWLPQKNIWGTFLNEEID